MKSFSIPTLGVLLSLGLTLTSNGRAFSPPENSQIPALHGSTLLGASPQKPFLFLIPATGEKPLHFSSPDLPQGLALDANSGIIRGQFLGEGEFSVLLEVANKFGSANEKIQISVHPDHLALTPPMGWNSWNAFGCGIDQKKILEAADHLVSTGLAEHGYQYIVIDDCWQGNRKDGKIIPGANFPDMMALSKAIHAKGLRFGIYSTPGPKSCQSRVGSLGFEKEDAKTFAEWGVDYLKYDECYYQGDAKAPYKKMADLIHAGSRDVVFSMSTYGRAKVWTWAPQIGVNLWRTTSDLVEDFDSGRDNSVIGHAEAESSMTSFAGNGHWNDPDMLVVGTLGAFAGGSASHPTALTESEQVAHLTLWSILAAPLMLGADLTKMDEFTLSLLTNDELIAIDQDPAGMQGRQVMTKDGLQIWRRDLSDGGVAIAAINGTKLAIHSGISFEDIKLKQVSRVRNIWAHEDLGKVGEGLSFSVESHGAEFYRIYR